MARRQLSVGEAVPWFTARSTSNPRYNFETVAGRYVILCFFGSASDAINQQILSGFLQQRHHFDDDNLCFFGISCDPLDEQQSRVTEQIPGIRYFWDFDLKISHTFGAVDLQAIQEQKTNIEYQRFTLILDERLRVLEIVPFDNNPQTHAARVFKILACLPPVTSTAIPAMVQAPVLVVPRVFEPQFCQILIRYYEERGGGESGFMREIDGKTVGIVDYNFKKRRDEEIQDEALRKAVQFRIRTRLVPEILKAFHFQVTRIERYLVACYDAETGGYFRPHRDNTSRGTAHRQFAVSINLNTGEYEGGDLRFPEFGRQTYRPPLGGAVVFSCSLLHEATPVTQGKRYAFLPFLYNEVAAKVRQENQHLIVDYSNS